jgi:hypothetical protein
MCFVHTYNIGLVAIFMQFSFLISSFWFWVIDHTHFSKKDIGTMSLSFVILIMAQYSTAMEDNVTIRYFLKLYVIGLPPSWNM